MPTSRSTSKTSASQSNSQEAKPTTKKEKKTTTKTTKAKTSKKVTTTKYAPVPETEAPDGSKESHLEKRFRSLWETLAPDLPLESQKKNVVPGRRYVYDFFCPSADALFEINGGEYMRGKSGHSSAAGIQRDADKSNRGQMEGYDVFMLNSCHLTVEYVDMLARYVRVKIAQERLQSTIAVLPLENK